MSIVPSFPPKQDVGVEVDVILNDPILFTKKVSTDVHPFPSVTVTVYVPAGIDEISSVV